MAEWTLSSFHKERDDPSRCAGRVMDRYWWESSQCSRKRGHGPEQAYCKQHDPVAIKAKRKAQREKWEAEWAAKEAAAARKNAVQAAKDAALAACKAIVDGHNDPRSLAAGVLAMLPDNSNMEQKDD